MPDLDLAFIDEILGSTRSKTNATLYLNEFLSSNELGREIPLDSGMFVGKSAKQVKTALDVARKKVTDDGKLVVPNGTDLTVRIKQETNGKRGEAKVITAEHVYLINTRLVAEARNQS